MLAKSWLFYLWRKPVKLNDLSWKSHSNVWHVKNTCMTIIYFFLFLTYIIHFVPFPNQDLRFQTSYVVFFLFVFNTLKWEVIVRFLIDIGEIVEHHLKYSFIISIYVFSDTCGGYYASLTGAFSSPNYPGDYPNNVDCRYTIIVPVDHYITLSFQTFNTESGFDYVKVRNIRYIDIDLSSDVWLNFDLYRKFTLVVAKQNIKQISL